MIDQSIDQFSKRLNQIFWSEKRILSDRHFHLARLMIDFDLLQLLSTMIQQEFTLRQRFQVGRRGGEEIYLRRIEIETNGFHFVLVDEKSELSLRQSNGRFQSEESQSSFRFRGRWKGNNRHRRLIRFHLEKSMEFFSALVRNDRQDKISDHRHFRLHCLTKRFEQSLKKSVAMEIGDAEMPGDQRGFFPDRQLISFQENLLQDEQRRIRIQPLRIFQN